jgi:hypothetical protein
MSLYQEIAAELKIAFKEDLEARDVTFRRYSEAGGDFVEGTSNRALAASQVLPALILPASGGTLEAFDVRFMNDVRDSANVRFALVAGSGTTFRPEPNDLAVLYADGLEWLVMGCTPLNVDGATDIIYSIGFRLP